MKTRLKPLRKEKGLSQTELSKKSGVSRMTIIGLERGTASVSKTDTLRKLADALDKPVHEVFLL